MTPRDARKAGASWGISIARARHGTRDRTLRTYLDRCMAERRALTPDLLAAFDAALEAAKQAEWARLEGETG